MRQAGLSVMALAGLMVLGAPIAQAGVTCKVVPSWCPGDSDSPGKSNKGAGGSDRVASNGYTGHDTGNSGGAGNAGYGGNGGTNTTGGGSSNGGSQGNNGGQGSGGYDKGAAGNGGSGTGGTGAAAPTSVPEPASLLLLAAGASAAGAAAFRRRKNKKD